MQYLFLNYIDLASSVITSFSGVTYNHLHKSKYLYIIMSYLYIIVSYLYIIVSYLYIIMSYLYIIVSYLYIIVSYVYIIMSYLYIIVSYLYIIVLQCTAGAVLLTSQKRHAVLFSNQI